jgi:hypothetical protein
VIRPLTGCQNVVNFGLHRVTTSQILLLKDYITFVCDFSNLSPGIHKYFGHSDLCTGIRAAHTVTIPEEQKFSVPFNIQCKGTLQTLYQQNLLK